MNRRKYLWILYIWICIVFIPIRALSKQPINLSGRTISSQDTTALRNVPQQEKEKEGSKKKPEQKKREDTKSDPKQGETNPKRPIIREVPKALPKPRPGTVPEIRVRRPQSN